MAVTLNLKSGREREFPDANDAFKRGPAMYVTKDGDEVWRGDRTRGRLSEDHAGHRRDSDGGRRRCH